MTNKLFPFCLILVLLAACQPSSTNSAVTTNQATASPAPPAATTTPPANSNGLNPFTVDDPAAERIKNYLINSFLIKDISLMEEADKQFQLYRIDMNKDGTDEYFVRFQSPYFCGSGGCTVLLLNNNLTLINRFTVMPLPVFVSNEKKNGWRTMLVKSEGAFREMNNEDGKYPANPSVLPASSSAPGSQYTVLFDDATAPSKTYRFSEKPLEMLEKGISQQRVSVFQRTYNTGTFVFKVNATNREVTPIHISTEGLPRAFDQTIEKNGAVKEGHLLDLNNDGFKELYLIIQPTGDSGNLDIMGIASYKDKSAGEIYVKDTKEIRKVNSDRVFVENGELRRTFVSNGKEMNFKYGLKAGETGFVLEAKLL